MSKILGDNAGELVSTRYEVIQSFLGPWLTQDSITMVHAWRGVGKTFFALQVAHAVAAGNKFLAWKASKPRRVIYFDGEMGKRALQNRIISIEDSNDQVSPEEENLHFVTFEHCGGVIWNLADPRDQAKYTEICKTFDVIIIDNISTCIRPMPRETELDAWLRVQEWAIKERQKGKALLFVHHSGKNMAQRGISNREDAMDTVINLRKPFAAREDEDRGASFELHFEKNRHFFGEDRAPLHVALEETDPGKFKWFWKTLKDHQVVMVEELQSQGFSANDIAVLLKITVSEINRITKAKNNEKFTDFEF